MTRERRLNDFLLAVTKSIFQELISMDAVMLKIMVKRHFLHHFKTRLSSRVMQKN
jgi:hypothetical protein